MVVTVPFRPNHFSGGGLPRISYNLPIKRRVLWWLNKGNLLKLIAVGILLEISVLVDEVLVNGG